MWCIDQFYILFWILLESGTAYCLSWRYLHWLDIEIVYCVFDTEKLILSKGWEQTAETLGEEFKLAEMYLMERSYYALSLDYEMYWHCEDNNHIWSSYLSESFVIRCFGIVRTIPTSSSYRGLQIRYLILDYDLYCFKELWHSSMTLTIA